MARRKEFKVDLHVHSMFSGESPTTPDEIVESAVKKGLDGICITEHGSLYASAPFEKFNSKDGLSIFRGVELSTNVGHILIYGVLDREWNDWGKGETVEAEEAVRRARELGGIAVPAHPWKLVPNDNQKGDPFLTPAIDEDFLSIPGLAAIEVCNGKSIVYPLICETLGLLAKRLRLGGTGGSDAHFGYQVGRSYTVFKRPLFTPEDLSSALLSLDYYPQNAF